jgi:hypothetical protein
LKSIFAFFWFFETDDYALEETNTLGGVDYSHFFSEFRPPARLKWDFRLMSAIALDHVLHAAVFGESVAKVPWWAQARS